jgi:hypothetical protein
MLVDSCRHTDTPFTVEASPTVSTTAPAGIPTDIHASVPHLLQLVDLQRQVADLLVILLFQQALGLLSAVGASPCLRQRAKHSTVRTRSAE